MADYASGACVCLSLGREDGWFKRGPALSRVLNLGYLQIYDLGKLTDPVNGKVEALNDRGSWGFLRTGEGYRGGTWPPAAGWTLEGTWKNQGLGLSLDLLGAQVIVLEDFWPRDAKSLLYRTGKAKARGIVRLEEALSRQKLADAAVGWAVHGVDISPLAKKY